MTPIEGLWTPFALARSYVVLPFRKREVIMRTLGWQGPFNQGIESTKKFLAWVRDNARQQDLQMAILEAEVAS